MSTTLAAADLGTNSFHLVVARFGDGTQFEVLDREKEMVRLGAGRANRGGDMKRLEPAAIDRGIEALRRFRKVAAIHDARLYAVATSAVREAANAGEFIRRAREEAGVDVEVISGVEEARLIHLGVLQAVPVFDRRLVLVDIGGGSTEILVGERGEVLASGSLKLGALRLTRRFFKSNRLHPGAVDACRRHIRAALTSMRRDVDDVGFDVAVGSSGTVEAVVAMAVAAREPDGGPPRSLNNVEFTRKEVHQVVKRLAAADTVAQRRQIPGLDERRADIILAGALVLDEVMDGLGIREMVLSDYALREGVLLDALERERGGALHHLHDLRRRSVLSLVDLMDEDPGHAAQVARLSLGLFDELAAGHGLDDSARELLEAGALLSNVGLFVSHSGHHKHSYYVIRNSDHLAGFTEHEVELVALIARYHRKSAPKASHAEFAALRAEDQDLVRTLAGILRVAIGLDRTHAGLVEAVEVATADDGIEVSVRARPGADLSLELFSANDRRGLLEEQLGVPVRVVEAARPVDDPGPAAAVGGG